MVQLAGTTSCKMNNIKRIRIKISGTVQGVGFRPFVYRLATSFNLTGWIYNDSEGVMIEAEGLDSSLNHMLDALQHDKPPYANYNHFNVQWLKPVEYQKFKIRKSVLNGRKQALILPDIATCPECLKEIFDPDDRRYLYPFTNCTHCGPRYSIITGLPYDRRQTTMEKFEMCDRCREEYEDPDNRRFHAQPNACPDCGPQMELWDTSGRAITRGHQAMEEAAEAIKSGEIIALKGIGGFQLIAEATNSSTIRRLRKRKKREEKPFALMVSSIEQARKLCSITQDEEELLQSPQAPIVILPRKAYSDIPVARSVAPDHPTFGLMLPYTPVHHILMRLIGAPVVATSGNISDEPICIDEFEALERLNGIADLYLVHNRPIERHIDDSVVRMIAGKPTVLRLARGYAPLPVSLNRNTMNSSTSDKSPNTHTILASGGHLKNSIAINNDNNIFISQYIGDLDTYEATKAYHKISADLPHLYDLKPDLIVHDLHPEYYTSKDADKRNIPTYAVQHHYAHILSCMAEHGLEGPLLGVACDGTGLGTDDTIWGGEFMLCDREKWIRLATFRKFRLPGGDKAMREPRRAALGMLFEIFGDQLYEMTNLPTLKAFSETELPILKRMLKQKINTPVTTSMGRIFDAIASLLDIRQTVSYEGQAAMALEHLIPQNKTDESYPFQLTFKKNLCVIDWEPILRHIMTDIPISDPSLISNKFHNTLSNIIVEIAKLAVEKTVVLSGGCFQNVYLTEQTIAKLEEFEFRPYRHQQIPPNDGGISAGQLYHALSKADELINKTIHYEVS
jgi:hydrogenase maturation protein HypF